ncbi:MAG: dihydroorotate dehydrogenase electron transfer subunit [Candidatus Nanopelagicales bacterium]|jgi:dihydroorotate dehydrogenase electron transfer subunit|nr:dihydroorotate dehydrogenase electron transfer subunit [Candidatus Nanopelagicales bacterium]
MAPVQVTAEVVGLRRAGAYHHMTLLAPGIPEGTRPGHFVALAVGGEGSGMLLRRAFSIHKVAPGSAGTVEIVFATHGQGTRWLADRRRGDKLDVIGPLGRPFTLPREPVACVLVAGGYGAAPLFALSEQLRARGCRVDMVLGAASEDRLFGVLEARRTSASVTVTTDDGSAGIRGRVTDPLPEIIRAAGADVVYACGPMAMLAAVAEVAAGLGAHSQCAVEEAMACGIGVCMTCVLPVRGADGVTRMVRSCTDGPVFRGSDVRWADVGSVPPDTLGAPVAGGH